ncbi:MAG: hypothetical protein JSR41_05710 [Proteobacteria bacterium]|nr:hypothetical protein [Pseudomonadota bacterium]
MAGLIERYLPHYQFAERHALRIDAPAGRVLDAAQRPDVADDPLARQLIALRELPSRLMGRLGAPSRLQGRGSFGLADFTPLGRDGDREIAFGLAGAFWQADYGLVPLRDAAAFEGLQRPGVAKLVLNFDAKPAPDGSTVLVTHTRVHCPDAQSLRRFRPYWLLIRPASGFIRRRLLRRIARAAAAKESR